MWSAYPRLVETKEDKILIKATSLLLLRSKNQFHKKGSALYATPT